MTAAVPLLMAVAAALMGWGYRRALGRSMLRMGASDREVEPPHVAEASRDRPKLCLVREAAAGVKRGSAIDGILKDALEVSARARLAHLLAGLGYAVVTVAFLFHSTTKHPIDSRFTMAHMILVPQLVILMWSLRLSLRQRLSVLVAYALVSSFVTLLLAGPERGLFLISVVGPLFALFPLAGLYFLFARRMRPFLVLMVAAILYIAAGSMVVLLSTPEIGAQVWSLAAAKPWLVAAGFANIVVGVILVGLLVRRRWAARGFIAALTILVLAGCMVLREDIQTIVGILFIVSGSVLQALLVWMIFKAFVLVQQRLRVLTPEDLQTHLCWTFLTFYFLSLTVSEALYDHRVTLRYGLLLALVVHVVLLQMLLFWIRSVRPSVPSKRLLLLRVFGRADASEELLDVLSDTWRRIGAVDMIAGTDVVARTLRSSMLEAFLLRRSDNQFLKTDADVAARLDHYRSEIEEDARYPVNAVYCYENVWQRVFVQLAENADAVLMDVRGFTADKKGCAWELAHLVQRTALRRIILLADRHTNLTALEQVARAAWMNLPAESPNTDALESGLRVLTFARRPEADSRTLFELLLSAGFDAPQAVQRPSLAV